LERANEAERATWGIGDWGEVLAIGPCMLAAGTGVVRWRVFHFKIFFFLFFNFFTLIPENREGRG
jgi:hypothetical protein